VGEDVHVHAGNKHDLRRVSLTRVSNSTLQTRLNFVSLIIVSCLMLSYMVIVQGVLIYRRHSVPGLPDY
jgi:hypothetical protein